MSLVTGRLIFKRIIRTNTDIFAEKMLGCFAVQKLLRCIFFSVKILPQFAPIVFEQLGPGVLSKLLHSYLCRFPSYHLPIYFIFSFPNLIGRLKFRVNGGTLYADLGLNGLPMTL